MDEGLKIACGLFLLVGAVFGGVTYYFGPLALVALVLFLEACDGVVRIVQERNSP